MNNNFLLLNRKRIRQNLSNIDFEEDTDSDEDWDLRDELPLNHLLSLEDISLSRISYLGSNNNKRGGKNCCLNFFI